MQPTSRRLRRALSAGACSGALLCLCPAIAAAAEEAPAPPAQSEAELGTHQKHVRLDLGLRTQFVKSAAFDPFSERDAFHQLSMGASFAFWTRRELSVAAVVGFDYGASTARARSAEASLDAQRFLLAPEARYHVLRVLSLTAKVGPTLTRQEVSLDGGLGSELAKTAWRFGFDATAGAALELWGYASGESHKPRLWLTAEGGYGWTAPNPLTLRPGDSGQAPQRLAPLELGNLSLGGPLFRITAALSFW